jgi:predicted nucleic acid-binding protein
MRSVVADASVAVKWYLSENFTTEAEKLLDGSYEIHAPELFIPEFGNIIWKKVRRNELTDREASQIISVFQKQSIAYHSHQTLLNAAFTGAKITGQTVYDWTYLALAISLSCEFVTADEKFYNSLEKTKLKKYLIRVGDL